MIIFRECARAEHDRDHNSREGHTSSIPVQGMKSKMQYRTSNLRLMSGRMVAYSTITSPSKRWINQIHGI
jgi:hypothetical protein